MGFVYVHCPEIENKRKTNKAYDGIISHWTHRYIKTPSLRFQENPFGFKSNLDNIYLPSSSMSGASRNVNPTRKTQVKMRTTEVRMTIPRARRGLGGGEKTIAVDLPLSASAG